jgi:hypothetical protein
MNAEKGGGDLLGNNFDIERVPAWLGEGRLSARVAAPVGIEDVYG